MWPAVPLTAALLPLDPVLKALSRKGKLRYEGKAVRLTNLENPGFFLGKGSRHRAFLRWGPLAVWIAAAPGASGYPAGAGRRTEQPV